MLLYIHTKKLSMALIQINEEYNMESVVRTVTPNGAKKSIIRAFKKKRPIFMWGPPGIGKSDIVGQITEQLKNSYLLLRLMGNAKYQEYSLHQFLLG